MFLSSVKYGTTDDNDKKIISDKDYLTCNKIWKEFRVKNMSDCHDHYLKKF